MQLMPRYLVKNRTNVIANVAGFITEYRPVYTRQLKVYKGIDNVLDFRLLNADQKPIDTSNYTPVIHIFDQEKNLVIQKDCIILDDGSSATKGLFKVTITDNETLNLKQQYMSYAIHLVDDNSDSIITYTETAFGNSGTMYLSNEAYPGPKATLSISQFTQTQPNSGLYVSETITAQPAINGNEALHTAVIYTNSYIGNVIVQATLDDQIEEGTDWADISTLTFIGTETEPTPVNFNGVFSHLRFSVNNDPANKISKVLIRN